MSELSLIVARMRPGDSEQVAELFARSDQTELPALVGVRRRTLFTFHDLYFHLIEADAAVAERVAEVRDHPLFQEINEGLLPFIQPYSPSWRSPADAMARTFYQWTRP
ncbi:TcmI family type II polyketide cyclase [Nocardia brasiliensis]|uniref:Polyketide synthesis cyclase n=1 Tax=Nocardia brasiliensis (strain ATCC 700358 / HUJEG-1) TaxID=1133849 RepID=K0EZY9_NOCB7|nr:TcmI family type II polyketide cyclase [Nocardia brasiliensis]AFU00981.1 polyketide synthesis cyclase [Nocardia brasiliensis ATCC 700358]OCF84200.1 polyketide synthase [Nocardia brasiliensis]